jgi:hypothetical protein
MFPTRDIANGFWAFVRDLAIDPRIGIDEANADDEKPQRRSSRTLDRVEQQRYESTVKLAGPDTREKIEGPGSEAEIWRTPYWDERDQYWSEGGYPWAYRTLQEALTAFLIDLAARDELTFDLGIWRCTVPVILGDAIQNPDLLRVILRDINMAEAAQGEPEVAKDYINDPQFQRPYTMTVSDDWSCLMAETFNHIVKNYTGKG